MNFYWHIVFAFFIRIFMILFSQWYDNDDTGVHYTDIDYKVFTDAAQHMLEGDSPYLKPTYRYTPLIAGLLIPNILLHVCWGKLLFSTFDLFIAIIIRKIVSESYPGLSNLCAYMWLYNPLSIVISTRGNADSISCFLVLVTLLAHSKNCYILSAICFAISVHVRIYPIIYGLVYYLSIDNENNHTSIAKIFYRVLPTRKKILFILIFILTLIVVTWPWYYFYGQKFLDESYLYHARRLDVRHNFSVYFYFNYLISNFDETPIIYTIATKFPPLILLLFISSIFSCTKDDLSFCLFSLTFIMVTFNTVMTSQYFIWYVCLIPLCYPIINLTFIEILNVIMIWVVPQVGWLMFAYCLEFLGLNTFHLIWVESLMFFIANVKVLSITIDYYKYNKLKKIL